ncbi:PD-(D/E)XK nuclease family protein [Lederbergia citrea]|uniref:PD-(D/E)XK nuclease family protein n=1 Tax=Lederbergia citrea TaxID=2833581 RepID=UPI001BC9D834|nr:PD-(D/E)XK nuclease family protein [Lederbergia citrea]MBS4177736.1 PD-(D/E)XK nuclease family protein [Lederbergia citrea]
MNMIDALNVFYREDTISDFLVNCFKDSDEFLIQFLKAAKIQVGEHTAFQIDTRVGLGESIGTPDIVIRAITNSHMKFIIVENKMGAAEGHEQTNRYESIEARTRIANKYNVALENIDFHFIFLALDTTAKPINSQFTFLNYHLFLQGEWPVLQETLQLIYKDFQKKLNSFYEPLKTPNESLESDIEMDGVQRKICWQTILFEAFHSNKELLLDWGEAGGSGRSNFLFLISKSNWTSDKSFREAGLAQTFNVHIDTYINMLNNGSKRVKEIGIRFETFPYEPHGRIKILDDYERFMENKRIFSERLFEYAKKRGIPAKRKNTKLLAMTVQIEALTIRETVQNIKKQFIAVEHCVDKVIGEMKAENLII